MKKSLITGLAVAAMVVAAFADVPQALTYRGVLRRSGGGEQSAGAIELTFRLYDARDGVVGADGARADRYERSVLRGAE